MRWYFFKCLLFFSISIHTQSAVIIVHGTWASDESWYQSCGDFFKSIQRVCIDQQIADYVIPFRWSGGLNFNSHRDAADQLVTIIDNYDFVILISHSHGGTVAVLASQILAKKTQNFGKIKKLYILGMPVPYDISIYPDMRVIQYCYNLFSFGDYVQRIGGMYTRAFIPHERLANLAVRIHDWYPTHSGMHSPIIAKELLKIHDFFINHSNNFENFNFLQPAQITFFESDMPIYQAQLNQRELLDIDLKVQWMHQDAYRKKLRYAH